MTDPHQENIRSFRFRVAALDLGVALLAEICQVFVKPGVYHEHRDETQVLFVLSGRLDLEIEGQTRRLAPGMRAVIRSGVRHRTLPLPGHERLQLLDLRIAMTRPTQLSAYVSTLPVDLPVARLEQLRAMADELAEKLQNQRDAAPGAAMLNAAVWSLLALYETVSPASSAGAEDHDSESPAGDTRLQYADLLMRDHLDHPLPIETLAGRVNLSCSRLRQLMLNQYGMPPQERYLQLRMEKARMYVESSTLTMKEIARACGFQNPDYFSRAFRAWAGATPTQVRRNVQKRRS